MKDIGGGDVWVLTGSTQVSVETFKGAGPGALRLVREFRTSEET